MATRKRKTIAIVEERTDICKNCKFAWYFQDVWRCRRYPPTVTYDYGEQTQCSTFPVTAPDVTCGEFSAQLNS